MWLNQLKKNVCMCIAFDNIVTFLYFCTFCTSSDEQKKALSELTAKNKCCHNTPNELKKQGPTN